MRGGTARALAGYAVMNTPNRPKDPPAKGASPDTNPDGRMPHGIPKGAEDHDATGLPSSDRQETETAPIDNAEGKAKPSPS